MVGMFSTLTVREAGFDLLRDNYCNKSDDQVQRPFSLCIVDEADFILIDEARVPLVLAGEAPGTTIDPFQIDRIVISLSNIS